MRARGSGAPPAVAGVVVRVVHDPGSGAEAALAALLVELADRLRRVPGVAAVRVSLG